MAPTSGAGARVPPPSSSSSSRAAAAAQHMPLKQKMTSGFRSLLDSAKRLAIGGDDKAHEEADKVVACDKLFTKVDPAVDGEDCDRDCDSCVVHYPKSFKVEESDALYGFVKGWSTHVVVATNKSDWVRDVEDEKGSVMQAFGEAKSPSNGKLKLSASNMPTPNCTSDYSEPTTVLLLPAFTIIENVTPATVPTVISEFINKAPTTSSPLEHFSIPKAVSAQLPEATPAAIKELTTRPCPHRALVLLCSHRTRDARCGQSAPLLRKELARQLQPLGLYRDLDDERPGGVGIYFINHVGGHKYSANVIIYRRPDAFGLDAVERAKVEDGQNLRPKVPPAAADGEDVGAAQCIWLARVRPEDCEGIVKYTLLQGKVVKPESQLRGGFDRSKGLLSW